MISALPKSALLADEFAFAQFLDLGRHPKGQPLKFLKMPINTMHIIIHGSKAVVGGHRYAILCFR